MKAPNTPKAPPGPSPQALHVIQAGEAAFVAGLAKARNRGGPVAEIDSLCARPPEAPQLLTGERLTRMTLGIQRLMQKRASMPGGMESEEIVLFFCRGPQAAMVLSHYAEEDQEWDRPESRTRFEEMVAEVDLLIDDGCYPAVNEWLATEFQTYTRLIFDGDDDAGKKKSDAGGSGSRVGWWLRAVEGICTTYAAACPAGRDLTQWAIWDFPVNDYLALQPAAQERQGVQMPEHYAIKEARVQRRKAKQKAEQALAKEPVPAEPVTESPAPQPEP